MHKGFEQEVVEDVDMVFKTSFSQPPISNTSNNSITVNISSINNRIIFYSNSSSGGSGTAVVIMPILIILAL